MKLKQVVCITGLLLGLANLAWAGNVEKYSCSRDLHGYEQGDFVVLKGDCVNLRQSPVDGRVLEEMPRHTLLRVVSQKEDWLQVVVDGKQGYVYGPLTGQLANGELTSEDFAFVGAPLDVAYDDLATSLGKGDYKKKSHGIRYYEYGKQLLVGVEDDKICSLETVKQDYFLVRGVGVGDTSARLVGQYGKPSAVIYESEKVVYEYFLEKSRHEQYSLDVTVDEEGIIRGLTLKKKG